MKKKVFMTIGLCVLMCHFGSVSSAESVISSKDETSDSTLTSTSDSTVLEESSSKEDESQKSDLLTAEETLKSIEKEIADKNQELEASPTITSGEVIVVKEEATTYNTRATGDVAIDSNNFPDSAFKTWVESNVPHATPGFFTKAEIESVTLLNISGASILDLKGIQYFTNLKTLTLSSLGVNTLDVSGMEELDYITIGHGSNPNLKTLDLRNCPKLRSAWHSVNQETVYISAGMLNYVGCDGDENHTGNLVIDLDGFYTTNPDGSKSVDLKSVLSPTLIRVFEKNTQPGYDPITNILTIPEADNISTYTAGKDGSNQDSTWTFHTKLGVINGVSITFESNGGSSVAGDSFAVGTIPTKPANPTRPGYTFEGWYADSAFTTPFDFTQPVTVDTTVYAKWKKNSSGGGSGSTTTPSNTTSSSNVPTECKPTCETEPVKEKADTQVTQVSGQSIVKRTGSSFSSNIAALVVLVTVSIAGTVVYSVKIEQLEATMNK